MRFADWGERCPRWTGVQSRTVDVGGTAVHYLTHAAEPTAPPGAPTHLLVHALAGSASSWLDVIPELAAHGHVVAPDLPGTILGHTEAPHPRAVGAAPSASFLRRFTQAIGVTRMVLHGWSMGGLAALLLADLAPDRVERLVLTAPTLAWPVTDREARWWRMVGAAALAVGTPVARGVLRLVGGPVMRRKGARIAGQGGSAGEADSRMSPELAALVDAELRAADPKRLGHAVTAFASVTSAMFVDRAPVLDAIARVRVPTTVLWGEDDEIIGRAVIDHLLALRPDWDLQAIPGAGHLLPLELPAAYVEAATRDEASPG